MSSLLDDGFVVTESVVGDTDLAALIAALETAEADGRLVRDGQSYAIRNLLAIPAVAELARSPMIRQLVEPHLGPDCFAVRGILFDKIPEANWKVAWHQDLTIEVQERIEVDGFGPWSIKAGIHHVQPPVAILEQMLAVRIHLDDCGPENGPLRVVPKSHCLGRLTIDQMLALRDQHGEVSLPVHQGDVILMRPLLAHASSAAESPAHRRVIHLEFAGYKLPRGLRWRVKSQFDRA